MVGRNRSIIKTGVATYRKQHPAKDLKLNGRIWISAIVLTDVFYLSKSSSNV